MSNLSIYLPMYIYIYIHIYIYIYIYKQCALPVITAMPQSHRGDNREGTLIS